MTRDTDGPAQTAPEVIRKDPVGREMLSEGVFSGVTAVRAARLTHIARLVYRDLRDPHEVAEVIGISARVVEDDLRILRAETLRRLQSEHREAITDHLRRLEEMEREAWERYQSAESRAEAREWWDRRLAALREWAQCTGLRGTATVLAMRGDDGGIVLSVPDPR